MSSKKITIDADFSQRLAAFLKDHHIKRKDFINKIGISKGYLGMILTGMRGPSAELIAGLFVHYGDHLYWLLTGKTDPNDKDIPENRDLIKMARAVLLSGKDYARSLAANIRSFHHSVERDHVLAKLKAENIELKKTQAKMQEDIDQLKEAVKPFSPSAPDEAAA